MLRAISKWLFVFFSELNNLSTADFFDNTTAKKGKCHEVERVVSHRKRKRKVS